MKIKNISLLLFAASLLQSAHGADVLINGNFEAFSITSGNYNSAYVPVTNTDGYNQDFGTTPKRIRSYRDTVTGIGWQTTAADVPVTSPVPTVPTAANTTQKSIEVWESGAVGINSSSGTGQFAELNSYSIAALYQDVQINELGLVDYTFSHRGRTGTDTLKVLITYLGGDNTFGTPDDVVKVDSNFSDNTTWGNYQVNDAFTSVSGGFYRFSFGAVSSAGGDNSFGNFLDNVGFGVNVVTIPEPSSALLGGLGVLGLALRRRRNA
jgi:PEP-CTERM motif